jgi:hypothetical protein
VRFVAQSAKISEAWFRRFRRNGDDGKRGRALLRLRGATVMAWCSYSGG